MLGKTEGRRGRQRIRWLDGITDSMDEFEQTPGNGEETGKAGVLESLGLPRAGHDMATTQ